MDANMVRTAAKLQIYADGFELLKERSVVKPRSAPESIRGGRYAVLLGFALCHLSLFTNHLSPSSPAGASG
jgi:hypothetical protein